ncbi:hypothetical protein Tco_0188967 [Tanacetum coccineum]
MEHARKQQEPKATITSSDTSALEEFDQKTTLFQTMTNLKSFKKVLMESILEDEDAMDEETKTRKDVEPSKGSISKESKSSSSKGTKSQRKSPSKSTQAEAAMFENVGKSINFRPPQKWISKNAQSEKPPLSFDELMSTPIDFSTYVMHNLKIDNLSQKHLGGPTFNLLKGTCKSGVELEYNFEECYKAITNQLD